ncbi:MAG: hypothetical protein ACK4QW_10105 [Alphaproteobacteria bacterium]
MITSFSDLRVAVVGLGYVGLPLALTLASRFPTLGFDIDPDWIDQLARGEDRTGEAEPDDFTRARHLSLACDASALDDRNFFVVTVPTPIDAYKRPDLGPLVAASETVAGALKPGDVDRAAEPASGWSGVSPDPGTSNAPYRIYNIGNNRPTELLRYIEVIEESLGRKATLNLLPMQPGDVPDTAADVEDLARDTGYRPSTPVEVGVARFVEWYRDYYRAG